MKIADQVDYLKSIAAAGCNIGTEMPEKFVDWIYWKLGTKIAEDYMIPYNQKMFGEELDQLGTYWLEKLPNVSFEETLLSCLERKAYGKQPGHAQFYYPRKYGYGELWLRMAESIKNNIEYNKTVDTLDATTKTVITSDGQKYVADIIITTIPWMEFKDVLGMPEDIKESIQELKFSSIQTEYFPENIDTSCHWIYYPDLKLPYHRILVRHNFCPNSRGYWTETNSMRIAGGTSADGHYKFINKYAYPLNTLRKPFVLNVLLHWAEKNQIYAVGRWGEHSHYNSDVTVMKAVQLVNVLTTEKN
jgi:protoporphyrinogen oxidase